MYKPNNVNFVIFMSNCGLYISHVQTVWDEDRVRSFPCCVLL